MTSAYVIRYKKTKREKMSAQTLAEKLEAEAKDFQNMQKGNFCKT
jgi:hypothetical protein